MSTLLKNLAASSRTDTSISGWKFLQDSGSGRHCLDRMAAALLDNGEVLDGDAFTEESLAAYASLFPTADIIDVTDFRA